MALSELHRAVLRVLADRDDEDAHPTADELLALVPTNVPGTNLVVWSASMATALEELERGGYVTTVDDAPIAKPRWVITDTGIKAIARPMYRVRAEREGEWWILTVPDVPGAFSQVGDLADAEPWIREALAMVLEVPEDSFDVVVEQ